MSAFYFLQKIKYYYYIKMVEKKRVTKQRDRTEKARKAREDLDRKWKEHLEEREATRASKEAFDRKWEGILEQRRIRDASAVRNEKAAAEGLKQRREQLAAEKASRAARNEKSTSEALFQRLDQLAAEKVSREKSQAKTPKKKPSAPAKPTKAPRVKLSDAERIERRRESNRKSQAKRREKCRVCLEEKTFGKATFKV
jgi:hypothetical protein